MSDIFKKIGDTITETGKSVGEKTKQVSSVAKFNAKIIASEHSVSENYTILGKFYYDTFKNDPADEVAETVNSITASLETIAEMKSQILAIKGMVKCQECGAECPFEDTYCGKCGAKLEKPEPPAEESSVEETSAEQSSEEEVPEVIEEEEE